MKEKKRLLITILYSLFSIKYVIILINWSDILTMKCGFCLNTGNCYLSADRKESGKQKYCFGPHGLPNVREKFLLNKK